MHGEKSRADARSRMLSGRAARWGGRTLFAGGVLASAVLVGPVQAQDVIGDDDRDVFVGTGSLILPEGMSRPGRQSAADCPGCEWKATLACDPVSPTACRGQARLCPHDHYWLKISMKQPGGAWQVLGSQCFGPGGPARRDAFETVMNQQVERAVPPLRPRHWPPTGVLPHLPVVFDSGHPGGPLTWTWSILGMAVSVRAQPTWAWQFDAAGPITVVTSPGGPTVDDGVHHTYRLRGPRQVTVRSTWSATYSVGGLGPLSVRQPVHQAAQFPLLVGEARAVLSR